MSKFQFDTESVRNALMSIDETSQESLAPPPRETLFMPPGHAKALNLSASVVVGMRGTGKSFWTAVLANEDYRDYVSKTARLTDLKSTKVSVGFALDPSSEEFPTSDFLTSHIEKGGAEGDVWGTVVLRHALNELNQPFPLKTKHWSDRVQWFHEHKEEALVLIAECDRELAKRKKNLLVIFDALDRLANEWNTIRRYVRALLKFALECRSRRAIRLKIFLRPDMEEDEAVWDFVDSSKLRAATVELVWRPADLFALVIHQLANDSDAGQDFRDEISANTNIVWQEDDGVYLVPRQLALGEQPARAIIEACAGAWVGTSAKRGYVYTWIPTHLADAKNRLSPRSFLLAFRSAAQWTDQHEPTHALALHFKGVQQGVSAASEIRVGEISEDYPWVRPLLEAARGLTVPCKVEDLTAGWPRSQRLVESLTAATNGKLLPRRFVTDPLRSGKTDALLEDLVELAIIYRTEDDRINVPDIFRVGFGIKRMGGVRPPR